MCVCVCVFFSFCARGEKFSKQAAYIMQMNWNTELLGENCATCSAAKRITAFYFISTDEEGNILQ